MSVAQPSYSAAPTGGSASVDIGARAAESAPQPRGNAGGIPPGSWTTRLSAIGQAVDVTLGNALNQPVTVLGLLVAAR